MLRSPTLSQELLAEKLARKPHANAVRRKDREAYFLASLARRPITPIASYNRLLGHRGILPVQKGQKVSGLWRFLFASPYKSVLNQQNGTASKRFLSDFCQELVMAR